jgi:hypothetical protein
LHAHAATATAGEQQHNTLTTTALPQQLFIRRLPETSLTIGPGQVAIVPVSFLPKFPPFRPTFHPQATLSLPLQVDLEDWMGQTFEDMMLHIQYPQLVDFSDSLLLPTVDGTTGAMPSPPPPRSNRWQYLQEHLLLEEYKVTTEIQIETSRGKMTLPISVSSSRTNDYGLPDVIQFPPITHHHHYHHHHDPALYMSRLREQVLHQNNLQENAEHRQQQQSQSQVNSHRSVFHPEMKMITRRLESATSQSSSSQSAMDASSIYIYAHSDCYDVYIKHPFVDGKRNAEEDYDDDDEEYRDLDNMPNPYDNLWDPIFVEKIVLKQTEQMNLLFLLPERSRLDMLPSPTGSRVLTDFTEEGPLLVPADDQSHYICTICAAYPQDWMMDFNNNNGYREDDEQPVPSDGFFGDTKHLIETKQPNSMGLLQIQTDMDTLFVYLERAEDEDEENEEDMPMETDDENEEIPVIELSADTAAADNENVNDDLPLEVEQEMTSQDHSMDESQLTAELDSNEEWVEPLLHSYPDSLDIHLMSSASPTARVPIDVYNAASHTPVTIMRMSAVWSSSEPELDERVGFELNLPGSGLDEAVFINLNETLEDAFYFECSIDWDKFARDESLSSIQFTGTIILRGSTRKWDYDEWEAALKSNPYLELDLVLEVPFSVTIIKGKIGFVVEQTTYPQPLFWMKEPWKEHVESVAGAFFPLTSADLKRSFGSDDIESYIDHELMEHQLRVFSNVDVETGVRAVEIVDGTAYQEGGEHGQSDSLCDRFDVSYTASHRPNDPFGLADHTDLGLITLMYYFADEMPVDDSHNRTSPTVCYLRLRTDPDTGNHLTPLIIYSASVEISGNTFQSESMSKVEGEEDFTEDESTVWHRTTVGLDKLSGWLQHSKAGAVLRSTVDSLIKVRRSDVDNESLLLGRYLSHLSDPELHFDTTKLRPILLEAGAIAQGEMETFPLYLTNHNPIPIKAMIDVGEIEGMSISIGRDQSSGKGDGHSLLDHLPRKPVRRDRSGEPRLLEPLVESGRYQGHPINGLRQFLLYDESATRFLSQFPYRDAVSLSDKAVRRVPMLDKLYRTHAVAKFHKSPLPERLSPTFKGDCGETDHPPSYGKFDSKVSGQAGPLIVSNDGNIVRRLPVCWKRRREVPGQDSDDMSILLPPGAVARFDVNLRSPTNSVLEKDITQFLGTGLVISTDHGDIMPIFVAFEALQGKLDVTYIPSSLQGLHGLGQADHGRAVNVPLGLFRQPVYAAIPFSLTIPPKDARLFSNAATKGIVTRNASIDRTGISLYMRSSFSRAVKLRKVSSCNPWFQVVLNDEAELEPDPYLGVHIGTVKSIVSCYDSRQLLSNVTGPGFFRCALNWLVNRSELQPRGCGLTAKKEKTTTVDVHGNSVAERASIDRAIRALRRALIVAEMSDGSVFEPLTAFNEIGGLEPLLLAAKSERRSSDGSVPDLYIDAVADVWDSWHTISELGLRRLSTSLRAIIEYNSTGSVTDSAQAHVLSVALSNLTMETVLDAPTLVDTSKVGHQVASDGPTVVKFPSTPVSAISMIFLPLRNPTGVPVRVRLATVSLAGFNNEPQREDSAIGVDAEVRRRYLGDLPTPYVQTGKVGNDSSSRVSSDHWWAGDGAFMLSSFDGDLLRSYHNASIFAGAGAHVSLCNPSLLGSTALMAGCGPGCGIRQEIPKHKEAASNPIGASAGVGTILSGRLRSKKSQENHLVSDGRYIDAGGSLRTGGVGTSAFAVPLSSLDEVVVPPFGTVEIGPIFFRPPGRFNTLGCEAKRNSGLFKDCESGIFESIMFLENSLTGLERVKLQGKTQWEKIEFADVADDQSDSFGDIELRNGRTTLLFPGTGSSAASDDRAGLLKPTVKEFLVINSGDADVAFKQVFFAHSTAVHDTATPYEKKKSCEHRNFWLLDCESLSEGFLLQPGQNRSIRILHNADCAKRKEYVSLNFEIDRSNWWSESQKLLGGKSFGGRGEGRFWRVNNISLSLRPGTVGLLVGYDMAQNIFSTCKPTSNRFNWLHLDRNASPGCEHRAGQSSDKTAARGMKDIFIAVSLLVWIFLQAISAQTRNQISTTFRAVLHPASQSSENSSTIGQNWMAVFRCLARVDPMAADLQTLGREQVRHILLSRYKALGVLLPQCLTNTGAFHRDRSALGGGRQIPGGKGSASDRIRTISDAIFHRFRPQDGDVMGLVPCDLGWRTAVARGIIDQSSVLHSPVSLKTEALKSFRQRKSSTYEDEVAQESSYDDSDDEDSTLEDDESGSLNLSTESADDDFDEMNGAAKMRLTVQEEHAKIAASEESASSRDGLSKPQAISQDKPAVVPVSSTLPVSLYKPSSDTKVLKLDKTVAISLSSTELNDDRPVDKTAKHGKKSSSPASDLDEKLPIKSSPIETGNEKRLIRPSAVDTMQAMTKATKPTASTSEDNAVSSGDAVNEATRETISLAAVGQEIQTKNNRMSKETGRVPKAGKSTKKVDDNKVRENDATTKEEEDPTNEARTKTLSSGETKKKKKAAKGKSRLGKQKQLKASVLENAATDNSVNEQSSSQANAWQNLSSSFDSGSSLRPPPGLVPPPGFGQSLVSDSVAIAAASSILADTNSLNLFNSLPATVSRSMSGESGEDLRQSPMLGPQSLTDTRSSLDRLPPLDTDALYHDIQFDVLDYLDGILNDAEQTVTDSNGSVEAPFISANPWATSATTETSAQSRLSAYGISIDAGSGRHDEDQLVYSATALAAAAAAAATTTSEVLSATAQEDENREHATSTFYTSWLGDKTQRET